MKLAVPRVAVLAAVVLATHTADAVVQFAAGRGAGDGLPATEQAVVPHPMASDAAGNLVFYDSRRDRLQRVDAATGLIHTLANGDDLADPRGLAVDTNGRVFVASGLVRRVDPNGDVTVVAGNGDASFCGDGKPALETCMDAAGVAVDAAGNLFIADVAGRRVRRVDAVTRLVTTVAGNGSPLFCGDGGAAEAACLDPLELVLDDGGNLFVLSNARVHRIDVAAGTITTVAGNGLPGLCGEGDPATGACIGPATSIGLDEDGALLLLVSDPFAYSSRLQRVRPDTQTIEGIAGFSCPQPPLGAGCQAAFDVAGDGRGGAYVVPASQPAPSVVRIDLSTGAQTVVAGNGTYDLCGDGGPAINSCITAGALARDDGGLYLGELGDFGGPGRIRKIDAVSGTITTLASPAEPAALLADGAGGLLFADGARGIRRVDLNSGSMSTICGDDLPAENPCLFATGLASDLQGDLLIATGDTVWRIDRSTNHIEEMVASTPAAYLYLSTAPNGDLFISDPVVFDDAEVQSYGRILRRDARTGVFTTVADGLLQTDILVDGSGTGVLFADLLRIGRVDLDSGQITTVAGAVENCDARDGAPNLQACLEPRGLALDRDGAILTTTSVGGQFDRRLVRITPEPPTPRWWCFEGNDSIPCRLFALEQSTPCAPGAVTKHLDTVLQRGAGRVRALLARSTGRRSAVRKARRVASRMALAAQQSPRTTKACRSGLRATAHALRRSLADI